MKNLTIAVQKSGRLHDESIRLLKDAGIEITNGRNQLKASAGNFPLDVLYLRNSDMLKYIADNDVDCGIIGENVLEEEKDNSKISKNVEVLVKLGFAKCRLALAIPNDEKYSGLNYFNGKKIATSYPKSLKRFLDENKLTASIHEISGSVEIAPSMGLADGICDLVSSGNTLFTNRLKEVALVMKSQALLVSRKKFEKDLRVVLDKLLFRINAVLRSRNNKYIMLNTPNDRIEKISKILPGLSSPTVMPLKEKGWSALHSVISENEFWQIIDKLKEAGAKGILVCSIEKMIE